MGLRQLGFSLSEAVACLDREDPDVVGTVRRHLERVEATLEESLERRDRLATVLKEVEAALQPSTEQFLDQIERTTMLDNYHTAEQREQLRLRADGLGRQQIEAVEAEWPELIAKVQEAMAAAGIRRTLRRRRWPPDGGSWSRCSLAAMPASGPVWVACGTGRATPWEPSMPAVPAPNCSPTSTRVGSELSAMSVARCCDILSVMTKVDGVRWWSV